MAERPQGISCPLQLQNPKERVEQMSGSHNSDACCVLLLIKNQDQWIFFTGNDTLLSRLARPVARGISPLSAFFARLHHCCFARYLVNLKFLTAWSYLPLSLTLRQLVQSLGPIGSVASSQTKLHSSFVKKLLVALLNLSFLLSLPLKDSPKPLGCISSEVVLKASGLGMTLRQQP